MKSVRFVCLFAILVSVLVLAQSSPAALGSEENRMMAHRRGHLPMSGLNFVKAVTYNSGGWATNSVAVADLNGDSKPDLVVANPCARSSNCGKATVGVLLGNGDGKFRPVVAYDPGGYDTFEAVVGDVNGDGKPDLLVANGCANSRHRHCTNGSVGVLLGNGDGTFKAVVPYGSGGLTADAAAVADVNGDGKPDLIVANRCASAGKCENGGVVGVLLNKGDGTFKAAVSYHTGGYGAYSAAVADVNGDGKPDLIVANYCTSNSKCSGGNDGRISVLLGNGDGTFQKAVTYASGGDGADSVTAADVNGMASPIWLWRTAALKTVIMTTAMSACCSTTVTEPSRRRSPTTRVASWLGRRRSKT